MHAFKNDTQVYYSVNFKNIMSMIKNTSNSLLVLVDYTFEQCCQPICSYFWMYVVVFANVLNLENSKKIWNDLWNISKRSIIDYLSLLETDAKKCHYYLSSSTFLIYHNLIALAVKWAICINLIEETFVFYVIS